MFALAVIAFLTISAIRVTIERGGQHWGKPWLADGLDTQGTMTLTGVRPGVVVVDEGSNVDA